VGEVHKLSGFGLTERRHFKRISSVAQDTFLIKNELKPVVYQPDRELQRTLENFTQTCIVPEIRAIFTAEIGIG
jgi:hypothetical protein